MEENISDYKEIKNLYSTPKLKVNPKTNMVEFENTKLLKEVKNLEAKLINLERKQKEQQALLEKLKVLLRKHRKNLFY